MKLSNKIVLVTGGTSGMGLEAAKLFRQEGATVIIVGQNPARLQSAASQLGDSVTVLRGDVSKPPRLRASSSRSAKSSAVSTYCSRMPGWVLPRLWKPSPKIKSTGNSM